MSTVLDRPAGHPVTAGLAGAAAAVAGAFAGLPATGTALGSGEISLAHAHGIARACADLPAGLDGQTAAAAEARMVTDAKDFDPIIAGRLARYVVSRIDPDGVDARDAKKLADDETKAAAANDLTFTPDGTDLLGGTGGYHLRGHLDPEAHAIVDTALGPLMAPRPDGPDGPDLRSIAARRADALVWRPPPWIDPDQKPLRNHTHRPNQPRLD